MPFRNPLALLGLLSVIPLIIIYLIRPKPKDVSFSSVRFLAEEKVERSAVLSRLIKDPLFWVQLLALLSLTTAAAGPYTETVGTPGSHLVVVLDVSASMESNFQNSIKIIDGYLDNYDRISIVLAENVPAAALESGTPAEARDTLARVSPRAVSADLSSAMILARGLLGSEGGNILVVSDFISWSGDNPDDTRKLLESNGGVSIVFAESDGRGRDNVGIIGGWDVAGNGFVNHTCLIHNYGSQRTVPITVSSSGGSSSQTLNLGGDQDYYFTFNAGPGSTTISLNIQDAISSDNRAYLYVPALGQKSILYLGDTEPSLAAVNALPGAKLARSGDPSAFDLVVVSRNASLDGSLNRYIDGGGKAIYVAYSMNESPEYLPVRITGESKGPVNLWVRSTDFAGDIHFDEIGIFSYLETDARRRSVDMIEANGVPILSYWTLGKGTVIYDGLEKDSDFYLRPEYPIFWYDMVNWIMGVPNIAESNRKTGEIIPLGATVQADTPLGSITTSTLLLDEVGTYSFQGKTFAANMYDPAESNLMGGATFASEQFETGVIRESLVENDISIWVIALAALAIILELVFIIRRREA